MWGAPVVEQWFQSQLCVIEANLNMGERRYATPEDVQRIDTEGIGPLTPIRGEGHTGAPLTPSPSPPEGQVFATYGQLPFPTGLGVEEGCLVRDEMGHSWELLGSAKSALEAVEIRCLHLETIRTGKREIN